VSLPAASPAPVRGAELLVVEDEIVIGMLLTRLLSGWGYRVLGPARNAAEALRVMDAHEPKLVLMDITLGHGSDGIALARQILADHDVQVVFISAHGDAATRARAEEVGPAAFITKPIRDAALRETVASILG